MRVQWYLSVVMMAAACEPGGVLSTPGLDEAKAQVRACQDRSAALESTSAADATPPAGDISGTWRCGMEGASTEFWRVAQHGGELTVIASNGPESWSMTGKLAGSAMRLPKNGVELQFDGGTLSGRVFGVFDGACNERALICTR